MKGKEETRRYMVPVARLLQERKESIRDHLDRHGLSISNVNAFMMNAVADPRQPYWHPSWIEPDPHYRAIRREHTKRALVLAKELGAASIQTEPGGPLRWQIHLLSSASMVMP